MLSVRQYDVLLHVIRTDVTAAQAMNAFVRHYYAINPVSLVWTQSLQNRNHEHNPQRPSN